MSPLRKVRTFDIPTHQITELELPNKSLFTGKVYNDLKKYYPFKILLNDPRFQDHPMVLETPKGKDLREDIENLKILNSLLNINS